MDQQIYKFDLKYTEKDIQNYLNLSRKILSSGFLTESTFVDQFTEGFINFQGLKNGVPVTSGTDALLAAFRSSLKPNEEILIPSNTFVATYISAKLAGLKIKLCDVEPEHGMLSLDIIKKTYSKNTKAVCVVHIGGSISKEIIEIKKFCKQNNILLFEDAAHSVGSKYLDIPAGNFGTMGCFSFFSTKSFTTGEGGFISCQTKKDYSKLKAIKNFGRTKKQEDWHDSLGFNMKVTELQAALGLIELSRIRERINKRRKLFKVYIEELNNNNIHILHKSRVDESSCYKIIMKADKKLISIINQIFHENKIAMTGSVYSKQIGIHKAFKGEKIFSGSQQFIDSHFCPPLYPELDEKDIKRICKELNRL